MFIYEINYIEIWKVWRRYVLYLIGFCEETRLV